MLFLSDNFRLQQCIKLMNSYTPLNLTLHPSTPDLNPQELLSPTATPKIHKTHSTLKSQPSPLNSKSQLSINRIRDELAASKERQKMLKNRIQYKSHQRDRQNKSEEQVRNKYKKVLSIRSTNLKEKKFISEEITNYKDSDYQRRRSQVIDVKNKKQQIEKSRVKISNEKFEMAKSVRLRTKANEETIQKQRSMQLDKNKQSAMQVQKAQQRGALILKKMSYRKVEMGKRHHQKKVWDEYKKLQLQKKKNSMIINRFEDTAITFDQQIDKASQRTGLIKKFLGLNRGKTSTSRPSDSSCYQDSLIDKFTI